jgi:hypothetical protein
MILKKFTTLLIVPSLVAAATVAHSMGSGSGSGAGAAAAGGGAAGAAGGGAAVALPCLLETLRARYRMTWAPTGWPSHRQI